MLLYFAPLLGSCFLRQAPSSFLAVDKASQPPCMWQSVPAAIIGTSDSTTETPRQPGLHRHPGSTPWALSAGPGLPGWATKHVSYPTRSQLFPSSLLQQRHRLSIYQALPVQAATVVLLRPFLFFGQDRPERVKGGPRELISAVFLAFWQKAPTHSKVPASSVVVVSQWFCST